jgi:hypothetical protein
MIFLVLEEFFSILYMAKDGRARKYTIPNARKAITIIKARYFSSPSCHTISKCLTPLFYLSIFLFKTNLPDLNFGYSLEPTHLNLK